MPRLLIEAAEYEVEGSTGKVGDGEQVKNDHGLLLSRFLIFQQVLRKDEDRKDDPKEKWDGENFIHDYRTLPVRLEILAAVYHMHFLSD